MPNAIELSQPSFDIQAFCEQLIDKKKPFQEKKALLTQTNLSLDNFSTKISGLSDEKYNGITLLQFLAKTALLRIVNEESFKNLNVNEFCKANFKVTSKQVSALEYLIMILSNHSHYVDQLERVIKAFGDKLVSTNYFKQNPYMLEIFLAEAILTVTKHQRVFLINHIFENHGTLLTIDNFNFELPANSRPSNVKTIMDIVVKSIHLRLKVLMLTDVLDPKLKNEQTTKLYNAKEAFLKLLQEDKPTLQEMISAAKTAKDANFKLADVHLNKYLKNNIKKILKETDPDLTSAMTYAKEIEDDALRALAINKIARKLFNNDEFSVPEQYMMLLHAGTPVKDCMSILEFVNKVVEGQGQLDKAEKELSALRQATLDETSKTNTLVLQLQAKTSTAVAKKSTTCNSAHLPNATSHTR